MTAPRSDDVPDLLPAARRFVDGLRELCRSDLDARTRWEWAAYLLAEFLRDEELAERAKNWPVSHDRTNNRYTNLLFYEDADHGFVLNGLVKDQTGKTPVHDHGHAWVLYGLLEGAERVLRFERTDDGSVPGRADLRPSVEVDPPRRRDRSRAPVVAPRRAGAQRPRVAVIVLSAKPGTFHHRRYDVERGTVTEHPAPAQIPHPLV
jgi:predicted metal-dependent enzyme (double-stranded beta helix superfamily)